MKFTIPGEAIPKGRPRFNRKTGSLYTPAKTREYEKIVGFLAMASHGKIKEGPVKFSAVFYTSKKLPPDIDNLIKAVLDGCNGQSFTDDSQVVEINARVVKSKRPRVEVEIESSEQATEE